MPSSPSSNVGVTGKRTHGDSFTPTWPASPPPPGHHDVASASTGLSPLPRILGLLRAPGQVSSRMPHTSGFSQVLSCVDRVVGWGRALPHPAGSLQSQALLSAQGVGSNGSQVSQILEDHPSDPCCNPWGLTLPGTRYNRVTGS